MSFQFQEFWVHIHNVPLLYISEIMGYTIKGQISEVMKIDQEITDAYLGKFLWLRVKIDLKKPFLKAIQLPKIRNEDPVIVFLIYEWISNFCYHCGIIEHLVCDCPNRLRNSLFVPDENLKYSKWAKLQVPSNRPYEHNTPPGYFYPTTLKSPQPCEPSLL